MHEIDNGNPQVRVFKSITWYKGEPGWTHALEGPHSIYIGTGYLRILTSSLNHKKNVNPWRFGLMVEIMGSSHKK